jgi:Concanavalin A-like lectin/glucanases superfamily
MKYDSKLLLRLLGSAVPLVAACGFAAANYQSLVLSDGPLAYYRLGDGPTTLSTARNSGSLGSAADGTHIGATHGTAGAIVGSANGSAYYNGSGVRTIVPYTSAINPPASQPFTIEAWVKPTIDGLGNAQAPLFNRHSAGNRQGWVFFQRGSSAGFNFRMYNQNGSTPSVDITGGTYTVGAWNHLVATWDGATASLYVNGQFATSASATYVPNSDIAFSVGAYAADNPGDNPYTGYVDEVAWYSNSLSAAQILAHYDNATNASRTVAYGALVQGDGAALYLRLNEPDAINLGSLGAKADGTHTVGVKLGQPGALVGSSDTAAGYVGLQDADGGSPTTIPFNAALNPSGSFSVEFWVKPAVNGFGNAQCPLHNRASTQPNGNGNRTGWDWFQRDQGTGWNWRLFNGNSSDKVFNITGGPYTVGQWHHLVGVYNASVPSATLYEDGVAVASSSTPNGTYAPKTNGDMAIGSYSNPALNDLGYENAFTGSIDEVAIYPSALSAATVLLHYQNGTNASRLTAYETLVAASSPAGYWRLDEPAHDVAANSGTLGTAAIGVNADTTVLAGPSSPAYAGFESNNAARYFDGNTAYVELLQNPSGLNFTGPISVEAWIKPDATQHTFGDIVAHGVDDTGLLEDMMRLTDGNTYAVASWDGANHGASAAIPGGDLGGASWIYMAGTYDGADWHLYRNGIEIDTAADATGAILVNNATWALGARGRWKSAFGIQAGASFPDRTFTGGIDEEAIYNYALSPVQIAAHYSMGAYGPNPLTITRSGSDVVLTWSAGVLQEASSVTGPYADSAASSPYTVTATGQKYYRLRFQ